MNTSSIAPANCRHLSRSWLCPLRIRGHSLLGPALPESPNVLDGGAHQGEFSRILQGLTGGGSYVLIEANKELAATCQAPPGGVVVNAALADKDGVVRFVTDNNPEAGAVADSTGGTEGMEIQCLSVPTLMAVHQFERVDVLKLDIEGQEFSLLVRLDAAVLGKIGQITVEFHDFLPRFANQGLYEAACSKLAKCGFVRIPMSFRMHSDILFVNARMYGIPLWRLYLVSIVGRWLSKLQAFSGRPQH